jgi:uncharacterized protein (TIGR00369 family)
MLGSPTARGKAFRPGAAPPIRFDDASVIVYETARGGQGDDGFASMTGRISAAEFDAIIRDELPWAREMGIRTDSIGDGTAVLRLPFKRTMVRPGGVIAGPTIMALADACMFAVALSRIGKIKLAVTTSFNINFLFRASPADLLAEGRLLRLGRRLAVMEVTVHCEDHVEPVAHATGTYSIPPRSDEPGRS